MRTVAGDPGLHCARYPETRSFQALGTVRFYGPGKPLLDKTWKVSNIERVAGK